VCCPSQKIFLLIFGKLAIFVQIFCVQAKGGGITQCPLNTPLQLTVSCSSKSRLVLPSCFYVSGTGETVIIGTIENAGLEISAPNCSVGKCGTKLLWNAKTPAGLELSLF